MTIKLLLLPLLGVRGVPTSHRNARGDLGPWAAAGEAGGLLDEERRTTEARRQPFTHFTVPYDSSWAECYKPTKDCTTEQGTATWRVSGILKVRKDVRIEKDCKQYYEVDPESGKAVMCRNAHGGSRGKPTQKTWSCISTNVGSVFKKKTAKVCTGDQKALLVQHAFHYPTAWEGSDGYCNKKSLRYKIGYCDKFSSDFYRVGREFSYRGFVSSSMHENVANSFIFGASSAKCEGQKVLMEIQRNDATPCLLDRGMSDNSREVEYLFRPHAHFVVTEMNVCEKQYGRERVDKNVLCIKVAYKRAAKSDPIRNIASLIQVRRQLELQTRQCTAENDDLERTSDVMPDDELDEPDDYDGMPDDNEPDDYGGVPDDELDEPDDYDGVPDDVEPLDKTRLANLLVRLAINGVAASEEEAAAALRATISPDYPKGHVGRAVTLLKEKQSKAEAAPAEEAAPCAEAALEASLDEGRLHEMLKVRLWGVEVHYPTEGRHPRKPMKLAAVLDAYTKKAEDDDHHKLYIWNHKTREFKKKETVRRHDGTTYERDMSFKAPRSLYGLGRDPYDAEIPAVKLYSMEHPYSGGTFKILNNLLSRGKTLTEDENDVQARLFEYNADPVEGRYLAKEHKFWLHAFRILWHTIAEMNLRTAQVAIATSGLFTGVEDAMTKMVNEKAFHDLVWMATDHVTHQTPDYPPVLYRGLCVAKGDIKLEYLTGSSTEGAEAAASAAE